MEHAKAERVVNELPRCRPTKKARRGTSERNEGVTDGRAESADAVGVQLRVLSLVPRARCICRWAGGGESREATTKSELTDGLSGRNPRRGKSGGVLLFGVLPPDRHGNAVTGCSAGRHQSGAARASFTKRAPYGWPCGARLWILFYQLLVLRWPTLPTWSLVHVLRGGTAVRAAFVPI